MATETQLLNDNIEEFLARREKKELLRFVTVGSVDDGKSTLIGRLLHDTDSLPEDQLAAVKKASTKMADGSIDFSLITDGLKAEREQGITIDVAYRYFTTEKRKFIIADTPGHVQYTRNMATGASTADVAIILIDARLGVLEQSRRHAYIASLLGIPNLLIGINKMDLKEYSKEVFESIKKDFSSFAEPLGFKDLAFFPISALKGDNIVDVSPRTPWFKGGTILSYLETVPLHKHNTRQEFSLPVQYVNRPNLNFRGFCGTILSGLLKKGDEILSLPSGKKSRVKSIVTYEGELEEAFAPMAVTVTLNDEIDTSRGDILVHPNNVLHVSRKIEATLVWMNEEALKPGRQYLIKHTTNTVLGVINKVHHAIDIKTLKEVPAENLKLNDIGSVSLTVSRPLISDIYKNNRYAGAFIVIDRLTNATVAAGMITGHGADEQNDTRALASGLTSQERATRFGQKASVIWLTGRPGSGKIVLARSLERRLFETGHLPYVFDPENTPQVDRHAQGTDLDKVMDYARLCLEAGMVVITAFTTPTEKERKKIRDAFGSSLIEIFVEADVETCKDRLVAQGRDPQTAAIAFDAPSKTDLKISGKDLNLEAEVDRIVGHLQGRKILL